MITAARRQLHLPTWGLGLLAALTLALGVSYTYVLVAVEPAPGFTIVAGDWRVVAVEPAVAARGLIQVGDELLRIGAMTRETFYEDRSALAFSGLRPGDHVTITRWRAGVVTEIDWILPPLSRATLNGRLVLALPALLFYLVGVFSHLLLRPRNLEWLLVVSFCYVMAVWLMLGIVSSSHVAYSSLGLHAVTWLLAANILDLHLTFPRPLWPRRGLRAALYGLAVAAAGLELIAWLPAWAYQVVLLLAMVVALAALIYHLRARAYPASRPAATLMLFGIGLGLGPGLALAIVPSLLGQVFDSALLSHLLLFAVPLLPVFYAYAIYKRNLGSLEFRANRVISVYLFLLVMGTALALVAGALTSRFVDSRSDRLVWLVLVVGLVAVLGTVFGLAPFQRLVDRYVLGVPPAPTHLLVTYASRIATCLELATLVRLLREDVMPGLLVRQSALLCLEAEGRWQVLYTAGLTAGQLPLDAPAPLRAGAAGPPRLPAGLDPATLPWVRLALPLRAAGLRPGVWLLGRRDPDDAYAATEVPVLQALADQVAVALVNIRQAAHLHALYQANVDRAESERMSLARELHDGPLNTFGLLAQKVDGERITPDFQPTYAAAVAGLRQSIAGLRPVTLSYGLPTGLRSLVSDLTDQWPNGPDLTLEAAPAPHRYPDQVETHVYRIVQQACLNALLHAGARTIRLRGVFEPQRLDLTIADDGHGFVVGDDLAEWLAQRHFGLAGMRERATLIGGELHIHSAPGAGTQLRLIWPAAGSA